MNKEYKQFKIEKDKKIFFNKSLILKNKLQSGKYILVNSDNVLRIFFLE
jgi:hypothetical protein